VPEVLVLQVLALPALVYYPGPALAPQDPASLQVLVRQVRAQVLTEEAR
jgi:hypothetical protein